MSTIRYAKVKAVINEDPISDEENLSLNNESDGEISLTKCNELEELHTEIHMPNKSKMIHRNLLWGSLLMICYFVLSIGLTFYQRYLLKGGKFAISVVLYHLIVKLFMAFVVRLMYRIFTGKHRVRLNFLTAFKKLFLTAFFGAIDIGFSQWGLASVGIALYTMTKSTTIIFISIFAVLFRLEKKSCSLLMIVVMISSGLFLFTFKSTSFDLFGFILLLVASFSSGGRWTMAQIVMQKSKLGLHNPIDMIYYMQPWMILSLLPFGIIFEFKTVWEHIDTLFDMKPYDLFMLWLKISIGAFLAFFMEISEFLVLAHTSSLTLSVAGIFKEICQLVLAVEINAEVLSTANILGLVLCLIGITSHVIFKYWILTNDGSELVETNVRLNQTNKSNTNENSSNSSTKQVQNGSSMIITYNKGNQKIPLLDSETDSEQDTNENHNSDVLFDILKRRT